MRHLLSALVLAALTSSPVAGLAQDEAKPRSANITFRVDLRLEGNVAAIDTGVEVTCTFGALTDIGQPVFERKSVLAVPVGPVSAAGTVPVEIRIEGYPFRYMTATPNNNTNFSWSCYASKPGGDALNSSFVSVPTNTALNPADAGTCDLVEGGISADATTASGGVVRCAVR